MFKKDFHRAGGNDDVPKLVTYLCPYYKLGFPNLDQIPENVEMVLLAFVGPAPGSQATDAYLFSSGRTKEQLCAHIKTVRARGTKVGLSIMDNPDNVMGKAGARQLGLGEQWPEVDKPLFAKNLKVMADDLEVDYVFNIDAESSTATAEDYIALIQAIRNEMPSSIINYVTYAQTDTDKQVLSSDAAKQLQMVMTMSYANSPGALEQAYQFYAQFGLPVAIGVKQGDDSIKTIMAATNWPRPDGQTRRMMLWNLSRQGPDYGNPGPHFGIYNQMYQSLHTPPAPAQKEQIKPLLPLADRLKAACETVEGLIAQVGCTLGPREGFLNGSAAPRLSKLEEPTDHPQVQRNAGHNKYRV